MRIVACMVLCVIAATAARPAAADQKPFGVGSLAEIERGYRGHRFVLVLWQIDCAPCHREMKMLGKLRADHPELRLVLLGTDTIELLAETEALLAQYGLGDADAWHFEDSSQERLRYSIDPEWYGELPRNYLYDADGSRTGFSGGLDEVRLRDWLLL